MSTDAAHSVVPPSARDHTVRPWFLVPFEALPVPVPWGAAGFSLLITSVVIALRPELPESFLASAGSLERVAVTSGAIIGCSIAAASIVIRSALRNLEALRPELDCSQEDFELLVRAITRQKVASAVAAALVGAASAFSVMQYNLFSAVGFDPWAPGVWFAIAMGCLQWTLVSSALWVVLSISLIFRRMGAHLPRVDLFDREALAPFQRVGLRLALITFGLFAVRFLLAVSPDNIVYLAVTSSFVIVLGSLALLLPLWGVRARIAAEKRRELAAIREAMHGEPTRSSDGSVHVSRELLNLFEYKERVESVREWLFDTPTFFRFLLYLGIPVLGWVGGAVVERLFDTLVSL